MTDATRQAFAGFGYSLAAADFDGDGIPDPLVGAPFENVDLVAADGDIETHLQIGQIELKQLKKTMKKTMKPIRLSLLACFVLCATFLTSTFGNHRSDSFALPELVVAGDFNGDGKLDLAVIVPNYSAFRKRHGFGTVTGTLRFFEIARLLVRFAHVASLIVNVNHSVM